MPGVVHSAGWTQDEKTRYGPRESPQQDEPHRCARHHATHTCTDIPPSQKLPGSWVWTMYYHISLISEFGKRDSKGQLGRIASSEIHTETVWPLDSVRIWVMRKPGKKASGEAQEAQGKAEDKHALPQV